jgi:hypothetical protein
MHYQFLPCGINGNYDNTGLSYMDRLGLHILYPEDNQVAEFVGTTVLRAKQKLRLQSAWEARGAVISFAARDFDWRLGGASVSAGSSLTKKMRTPGNYALEFTHRDFLGRRYSYQGVVRVLSRKAYSSQILGPLACRATLL